MSRPLRRRRPEDPRPARGGQAPDDQEFGGWLDRLSILLGALTFVVTVLLVIIIALLIVFGSW